MVKFVQIFQVSQDCESVWHYMQLHFLSFSHLSMLQAMGLWRIYLCALFFLTCSEGLGEAYDGDVGFASALETFGGGHNDPISLAFGGIFTWNSIYLLWLRSWWTLFCCVIGELQAPRLFLLCCLISCCQSSAVLISVCRMS